jgi:ribosomal protein L37AE/L43A
MKKVKPKKYKCPSCDEEFNTPLTHKNAGIKICPKCGYLATPLPKNNK